MGRGHRPYNTSLSSTPGAHILELTALGELGKRWREQSDSVLVISDVHSRIDQLQSTLKELGAIDEEGERLGTGVLLQIGDLIDGRDARDLEILKYGQKIFDVLLAGNHEAAYTGGKKFTGQWINPDLEQELSRMIYQEQLHAAYCAHGVLVVHGGAHPDIWPQTDADSTAAAINERWEEFYFRRGPTPPAELFAHTHHGGRGGSSAQGGALWCDWRQLVDPEAHSAHYRQIVGHSPLTAAEASDDQEQVIDIDLGGARLGVALIERGGQISVAAADGLKSE